MKIEHTKEFLKERQKRYNKTYQNKKKHKKVNKITTRPRIEISYSGKDKQAIREHKLLKYNNLYKENKETSGFDLYGAGESFNFLIANTKAKVLSIDDDDEIGKKLKNIPNTMHISIQNLCNSKRENFNIGDFDYCGMFGKNQKADFTAFPQIMMNDGIFWLTLCMRTANYDRKTDREDIETLLELKIKHIFALQGIYVKRNFTVKYAGEPINLKTGKITRKVPMLFYEYAWTKTPVEPTKYTEWPAPTFITIDEMIEMDKTGQSTVIKKEELLEAMKSIA